MLKNLNFRPLLKLLSLWLFIFLFYRFGPISEKPFSELSSFSQYKPCEDPYVEYNPFSLTYELSDILIGEFQASWIIFGIEQDWFLENGLDCQFEPRYNFSRSLELGLKGVWRFLLRRIAGLGSYICVFLILRFSYLTAKQILV